MREDTWRPGMDINIDIDIGSDMDIDVDVNIDTDIGGDVDIDIEIGGRGQERGESGDCGLARRRLAPRHTATQAPGAMLVFLARFQRPKTECLFSHYDVTHCSHGLQFS